MYSSDFGENCSKYDHRSLHASLSQSGALVPCMLLGGASLERTVLVLRSPGWQMNKLNIRL